MKPAPGLLLITQCYYRVDYVTEGPRLAGFTCGKNDTKIIACCRNEIAASVPEGDLTWDELNICMLSILGR
jgi:hypothetical protein